MKKSPKTPQTQPRLQLRFDPHDSGAREEVELPFVIGVMADLSGKPLARRPPHAAWKFVDIDNVTFDERLRMSKASVDFVVPNMLTGNGNLEIGLAIEKIEDFSPWSIAQLVGPLRNLVEILRQLSKIEKLPENKEETKSALLAIVDALRGESLAVAVPLPPEPREAARALRSVIECRLSEQINCIIHHPAFLALESTWRGLLHLVRNTASDNRVKIRILDVSK
jgi:type VI secretion system protein ImpB